MLNYLSFGASAALVGSFRMPKADFLMVESPPLFIGPTGVWLSTLKASRMIFNVSDLWPETAVHVNKLTRGSWAHRASSRLERYCYHKAWLVSGQSREIVETIARRFPEVRTYHLSNGVETNKFGPDKATGAARQRLGARDRCVALYAGLHGLAQGLHYVVEAMRIVGPNSGLDLVLIGDGPDKVSLKERASDLRGYVRFLDPRPHSEVPSLLASADILIVPLATQIPGAVPSKLYEAMASGKPVLLMADGEAASIVRESECGFVVPPGDAASLAQGLERLESDSALRSRLGANGRRATERLYDRSQIADRFIDLLEEQVKKPAK
jgi:glycosyltransferase involved in cell wall biosynthesis